MWQGISEIGSLPTFSRMCIRTLQGQFADLTLVMLDVVAVILFTPYKSSDHQFLGGQAGEQAV
jgi:hypothetical protein